MKNSIILLALVCLLGLAFATGSEALTGEVNQGSSGKVKLYYGTYGSDDYFWGTVGSSLPTDFWQLHSAMPGSMMDNACATDGNYVYVLAGYGITNVLYRHAVGSTTWESKASCPLDISNGGAGIIGDTLYYCSGYSYTLGGPVDTMFKYCISTNTWTSGPGPFTGTTYNWQPLILVCNNKLYYISGCNQPGATAPTKQVWCYTPGSGWAQATDMNQGRVFAHGCVYHDTIWVTGGNANEVALTHSEFYDPVSETWTVDNSLFPNLPVATWAGASGIVGQTMFVFSGVGASLQLMDTTQYFDFATRTWTVTPSVYLMVYRGCGTGNADGKAVVYGGSTGGFTPTNICQYEQLGTGAVESKSDNWKEIDGIAPTFIHDFCRISYNVPVAGKVTLNIYDASGSLVKTLVNGMSEPGEKNVAWDRRDAKGNRVVSGTYFFRLSVPNRSVSAKAILLQ